MYKYCAKKFFERRVPGSPLCPKYRVAVCLLTCVLWRQLSQALEHAAKNGNNVSHSHAHLHASLPIPFGSSTYYFHANLYFIFYGIRFTESIVMPLGNQSKSAYSSDWQYNAVLGSTTTIAYKIIVDFRLVI